MQSSADMNEMVFLQVALGDVGQVQKVERDIKQNVYLHVSLIIRNVF